VSRNPVPVSLLPETSAIVDGRLGIAGCDVEELARRYGTPAFIYDEQHLIDRCEEAVAAFPDGVAYASKAFLCTAMARLAVDAGMQIDVATGGEIHVAAAAGIDPSHLVFHGNNKSMSELELALDIGVGMIVVDSFDELDRIESIPRRGGRPVRVLLRLNPGIEAHTHEYLQTGALDSKFGFPIVDGIAESAIGRARGSSSLDFAGIHIHIGSQVFDTSSFARAMEELAPIIIESQAEELSIGGGLGVAYVEGETAPTITEWAHVVRRVADDNGIDAAITAEPGRSIVATAAVTTYSIGTIKNIPGVRTYVAVDGGMSDNPRPVLYGSGYEAFLATAADAERPWEVRIVGKHCESGDVIVRDASLPAGTLVGDILCTPVTGAYGHSMGSNYNKVLRPPVVFVKDGMPRVVVERETYNDLLVRDVGS
jgi:diaminopimelate decarboxylase